MPFMPGAWGSFRFHFDHEERPSWFGLTTTTEIIVVLDDPLAYREPDGDVWYTVPPGFRSDGASVPKWAQSIVAMVGTPWSEALRAAVIHDWLHAAQPVSWWVANRIFRAALREDRANRAARSVYWAGVTVGGWVPWLRSKAKLPIGPLRRS